MFAAEVTKYKSSQLIIEYMTITSCNGIQNVHPTRFVYISCILYHPFTRTLWHILFVVNEQVDRARFMYRDSLALLNDARAKWYVVHFLFSLCLSFSLSLFLSFSLTHWIWLWQNQWDPETQWDPVADPDGDRTGIGMRSRSCSQWEQHQNR